MQLRRAEIPGPSGRSLAAVVDLPVDGRARAWALFAHCFTCSKDLRAAVHLARALNEEGIGVLRFDFTGPGAGGSDGAEGTFAAGVDEVVAAAEWLAEEHDAPQVLVGHSLGGAAVLRAAARIPSARAVATLGAPAGPEHLRRLFADHAARIEAEGSAEVRIAGRAFRVTREFLRDLDRHPVEEAAGRLRAALLVMHAPRDEVVGIDEAAKIFLAAKHPRSFVSLDDADHLLSRERDSRYAGTVLAAWADRYLEPPEAPTLEALAEEGVVTRTGDEGYRTEVRAGRHGFALDEPEAVGGHDTAATPYDHLAAALGACTGMTLRMYADRKGWPLEGVTVRLAHHRVHGEDERRCADAPVRMDRLERVIELEGPLDDAQRARLREIADRCPVHRTLDAGVRVETRLADEGEEGA